MRRNASQDLLAAACVIAAILGAVVTVTATVIHVVRWVAK